MAVRNSRSAASDHRRHDRLLVARFAVGDAEFGQEREAKDLVRRCSECAALAADIGLISKGVAQMPAPRRPRDFRLSPEQADGLRGSAFGRFLRSLTGSGWAVVRPVAGVALSIGLVMSVVGFLPIMGGGGPAAAPEDSFALEVAAPGPTTEGQTLAPSELAPGVGGIESDPSRAIVADNNVNNAYLKATGSPVPALGPVTQAPRAPDPGLNSRDLLFVGGLAVTVLALMVLALLYGARRRFTDPLLR